MLAALYAFPSRTMRNELGNVMIDLYFQSIKQNNPKIPNKPQIENKTSFPSSPMGMHKVSADYFVCPEQVQGSEKFADATEP